MKNIKITADNANDEWLINFIYSEIEVGDSAEITRTLTPDDIKAFAAVSGDINPAHMDPVYSSQTLFHGIIGHGMWGGALISTVLGTVFPGPGTIYLEQILHFSRPVRIGDTLTVTVTCKSKNDEKKSIELDCSLVNQKGDRVLSGVARVLAPTTKLRIPKIHAPKISLSNPHEQHTQLLSLGAHLEAVTCGVVHPCDEESLRGAMDAQHAGLINAIIIAPEKKVRAIAEKANIDLSGIRIINVQHSHEAADVAAQMAADHEVEALMKGSLHTDELIHAVIMQPKLRTGRRMSHVYRFQVPMYPKPLCITDAALNIAPTLDDKVDIVKNAIDFAHIMGINEPKVAILAAVETVNSSMPSTLEAAALCKMADRGQITGGILDGPLAFDNAISPQAAELKHIQSLVAGQADILVAPDLEAGNMMIKQAETFSEAYGAGVVLGARVPIALTSRSDTAMARCASALLAKLIAHHNRHNQS